MKTDFLQQCLIDIQLVCPILFGLKRTTTSCFYIQVTINTMFFTNILNSHQAELNRNNALNCYSQFQDTHQLSCQYTQRNFIHLITRLFTNCIILILKCSPQHPRKINTTACSFIILVAMLALTRKLQIRNSSPYTLRKGGHTDTHRNRDVWIGNQGEVSSCKRSMVHSRSVFRMHRCP